MPWPSGWACRWTAMTSEAALGESTRMPSKNQPMPSRWTEATAQQVSSAQLCVQREGRCAARGGCFACMSSSGPRATSSCSGSVWNG